MVTQESADIRKDFGSPVSAQDPKQIAKMLESQDPEERSAGLAALGDNVKALTYVALESEHSDARLSAVAKLTDVEALTAVAQWSAYSDARNAAKARLAELNEVNDSPFVTDLATILQESS